MARNSLTSTFVLILFAITLCWRTASAQKKADVTDVISDIANGFENGPLETTHVPNVTAEPESGFGNITEICQGSGAGLRTCVSRMCPKTGLLQMNECKCLCCNGLQPFCDETCYKEPESGVQVCIRQCKCRRTTRQYLCVSTAWLVERGLQDRIIHTSAEKTRVLCIRNSQLPCATPGHLLRICDIQGKCNLKSYEQVCRLSPLECVEALQQVSRLSHNHQWDTHRHHHSGGNILQLTSLSVKTKHGAYCTYKVAQITEFLISVGLGRVCDLVQMKILALKSADYRAIFTRWNEIK